MNMNYLKELKGKTWLEPAQWAAKNAREDEAFKARLASLPKVEAKAVCIRLLALAGTAETSSGRIAAAYLTTCPT